MRSDGLCIRLAGWAHIGVMIGDIGPDRQVDTSQAEIGATEVDPGPPPGSASSDGHPTAARVAELLTGLPTIGRAREVLGAAGLRSHIEGNRITVNDSVFARHIEQGAGPSGRRDSRWVVYGAGEHPAVRIVVAYADA